MCGEELASGPAGALSRVGEGSGSSFPSSDSCWMAVSQCWPAACAHPQSQTHSEKGEVLAKGPAGFGGACPVLMLPAQPRPTRSPMSPSSICPQEDTGRASGRGSV